MKRIKLTSDLVPIAFVGMYDGQPSDIGNYFYDSDFFEDNEDSFNWDVFNREKWIDFIFNNSIEFINAGLFVKEINKLGIGINSIEFIKIHSPKYYNFETDELYFDLIVNDNFNSEIIHYVNKMDSNQQKMFSEFLNKKYSSRDGFCSFTPNNIIDLVSTIENESEGYEQSISAIFSWILGYNELLASWYNIHNWFEFINEKFPGIDSFCGE